MREKIKVIVGEELYDIGPAMFMAFLAVFGIITVIVWSLPF